MHELEFWVLVLILSLFTFFFQSRTSPLRVLSATLDLPEQPGFGLCFAFLLGQICDCKLDFQSLTNMDIPAKGFFVLVILLEEDCSYTN